MYVSGALSESSASRRHGVSLRWLERLVWSPQNTTPPQRLRPQEVLTSPQLLLKWGYHEDQKLLCSGRWSLAGWQWRVSRRNPRILHILGKPRVHHLVHNRPPLVPILSQTNSVQATPSGFRKMRFNIILPSTPTSFKWRLSFGFTHQNLSSHQNVPYSQLATSLLNSYYSRKWSFSNISTLPDYTALLSKRQKYSVFCTLTFWRRNYFFKF